LVHVPSILAYAVKVSIRASSIDVFLYMCMPHCTCVKSTFPHTRVHSREINDGINFGGDSGSDTGEAGSSSQIASIRHVLRRVNMFLLLSLYFCMYVYVSP